MSNMQTKLLTWEHDTHLCVNLWPSWQQNLSNSVENSIHHLCLAILHLFLKVCWCLGNLKQKKPHNFIPRVYSCRRAVKLIIKLILVQYDFQVCSSLIDTKRCTVRYSEKHATIIWVSCLWKQKMTVNVKLPLRSLTKPPSQAS